MNYKLYDFTIDIINIILEFFVSFSLLGILILFVTEDQTLVLRSLILLPAPIISYLIGKQTHHVWSLFVFHMGLYVFYFVSSSTILIQVLYSLYLTFLLILEFRKKITEEYISKTNTSLMLLPLFVLLYFFSNYLNFKKIELVSLVLVILFVIFYLLNTYLLNFSKYFKNNEHITNIPIQQIKMSNNILIIFYSSLCVIVMMLFTKLPFGNMVSSIGNSFISLLRYVLSFLFRGKKEESLAPEEITQMDYSINTLPNQKDPSPILDFILNLIFYILSFIVIIGIIALIIYGIYKLYQLFYVDKLNSGDDHTEFVSPFDKKEKTDKPLKTSPLKNLLGVFGRTNNDKIRKYYFKAIRKNTDPDLLSNGLTPSKLSEFAFNPGSALLKNAVDTDKINTLTEHYEKARYSNTDCSKEELQTVKAMLK